MRMFFQSWFQFPRLFLLCFTIAFFLLLPSIGIGFFADDYFFLMVLEGKSLINAHAFDMYRFVSDDPEIRNILHQDGYCPWWTLPALRINFFRPLSSLLWKIDYQLFGHNAVGYHLHSILWFFIFLLGLGKIYQKCLTPRMGALALLIYTLSSSYAWSVIWLSNRNALIGATPVLWGLYAHICYRQDQWRFGLPLSFVGYFLGLLGGETALGIFCYLGAYELLAGPGGWKKRIRALVPVGILGIFYVICYKKLGCGSFGSGFYVDPVSETGLYLQEALLRIPALLADAFVRLIADIWIFSLTVHYIQAGVGFGATFGVLLGVRHFLKNADSSLKNTVLWFTIGSGLSLIPLAATIPMTRLLLCPFIGIAVLLAVLFDGLWKAWGSFSHPLTKFLGRGFILFFTGIHFIISPLHLLSSSFVLTYQAKTWEQLIENFERVPDFGKKEIIMPVSPDHMFPMYFVTTSLFLQKEIPKAFHTLCIALSDRILTRIDANTIELETVGTGAFLTTEFETLWRSPQQSLKVGETISVGKTYSATVLDKNESGPTRIRFKFHLPIEEASIIFLQWKDQKLVPLELPKIGEKILLKKTPGPSLL